MNGTIPLVFSRPLRVHCLSHSSCSRIFENSICRRDVNPDPERTESMAEEEKQLAERLNDIKWRILNRETQLGTPNEWVDEYVRDCIMRRDTVLACARRWFYLNDDLKGTSEWKREVHSRRRIIAIYHQEIFLYRQCAEIFILAEQLQETIAQGCRFVLKAFLTMCISNIIFLQCQ